MRVSLATQAHIPRILGKLFHDSVASWRSSPEFVGLPVTWILGLVKRNLDFVKKCPSAWVNFDGVLLFTPSTRRWVCVYGREKGTTPLLARQSHRSRAGGVCARVGS